MTMICIGATDILTDITEDTIIPRVIQRIPPLMGIIPHPTVVFRIVCWTAQATPVLTIHIPVPSDRRVPVPVLHRAVA